MKIRIMGSLVAMLAASFCSLAHAGVINFDDLAAVDDSIIPPNYADHGLDGNGDANVGVAYRGSDNNSNNLRLWSIGYGNLSNVGFSPDDGTHARVDLTADAGWLIDSIEFDLAAFPDEDVADRLSDVTIGLGALVQDNVGVLILGGTDPFHNHFSLSGAGASTAFIVWGTDWNVGIDNIVFNVRSAAAVPEPGTLALLGLGLAGLGFTRRRKA